MRITLNLATRPFADLGPAMKRLRIAMGALAAVSLGLALGLHALHNRAEAARAHEHSLDGQLAQVTVERQGYADLMQEPPNARLLTQAHALNQLIDAKAFSWTLAMENLETVLPGGVAVTTLEPVRSKEGVITLHLRVVGPRDLGVDLVRNLEHSKRFLNPRIVGENAEAAGSGANQHLEPVSASNRFDFDLLAEYNPPSADEMKEEHKAATAGNKQDQSGAGNGGHPSAAHRVPRFQSNIGPNRGRSPYTGASKPAPRRRKPNPATPQTQGPQTQGGPQ